MNEEEFIQKLKEIGFENMEIMTIQNNLAIKLIGATLAQKGILDNSWDFNISNDRAEMIKNFTKIKEQLGIPWEEVKKFL